MSGHFSSIRPRVVVLASAAGLFLVWVVTNLRHLAATQNGTIRFFLTAFFGLMILLRPKPARDRARTAPLLPAWAAALLVVAAAAMAVLGMMFYVHQVEWLGLLLLLYACLNWALPPRFARDLPLALLLIYWAHPLPSQLFGPLQLAMQRWSVAGSEWLLHLLNVRVWGDGLVLRTFPHGAGAYATAIVDTLDFLSRQSLAVPLVAIGARSGVSIARRIKMLKSPASVAPLTVGRLLLLAAVAALPMALGFAAESPQEDDSSLPRNQQPTEKPAVQRRAVNRLVTDFPENTDLSTPESALAAWNRAWARGDDHAVLELTWVKWGPREIEKIKQYRKSHPKESALFNDAMLNAEILEVLSYRADFASVTSKLAFPEGVGNRPYSTRSFGRINGLWKNLGEDRVSSLEAARESFDRKKDSSWQYYVSARGDEVGAAGVAAGGIEGPNRSHRTG